jgi:tRNA dimethylallyltransferase
LVKDVFYIVGPTATGKSDLAADLAHTLNAEIVGADAFQIYSGLDLLTAKPDAATLKKAPHHLIGTTSVLEEMNVEKFRAAALRAISDIRSRRKPVIVVGGTGLYIKALTHGLATLPSADPKLREHLNAASLDELRSKLAALDPETADRIDMKNRRRVARALEICLTTGRPASDQRAEWAAVAGVGDPGPGSTIPAIKGVFVFRDRDDLYQRINSRVDTIFEKGVIDEVRATGAMSGTASQMIGLREIREHIDGKLSLDQCIAAIQQATRRYAKRQLTWFRRQTSFEPLNLSLLTNREAGISQLLNAFQSCVEG